MSNEQKGSFHRYTRDELAKMPDRTDYKKLDSLTDADIDYSDSPEFDLALWANASVVDPGNKIPVSMRVDADVLRWYKKQDGRYQKLMNNVLRQYMLAKQPPNKPGNRVE